MRCPDGPESDAAAEGGHSRRAVLVDPGVGFGKRFEDNLR
jgi:hypothetical protein